MRCFHSLSVLFLVICTSSHAADNCDENGVVRCFSSIIGPWLNSIWMSTKDIETLVLETCNYQLDMQKCVNYNGCSTKQIHKIAAKLAAIMHMRPESGNFLSAYYSLQFICSLEGKSILLEKLRCLQTVYYSEEFMLGAEKLHKTYELRLTSTKLYQRNVQWKVANCRILTTEVDQIHFEGSRKCGKSAGDFACKSFVSPFLHLQPHLFDNCQICSELDMDEYPDDPDMEINSTTTAVNSTNSHLGIPLKVLELKRKIIGDGDTVQMDFTREQNNWLMKSCAATNDKIGILLMFLLVAVVT